MIPFSLNYDANRGTHQGLYKSPSVRRCIQRHVLSGTVSVRQRNVYENENTNQATGSPKQVLAGHTLTCMNYELMSAYPASTWLVHVGTTHL